MLQPIVRSRFFTLKQSQTNLHSYLSPSASSLATSSSFTPSVSPLASGSSVLASIPATSFSTSGWAAESSSSTAVSLISLEGFLTLSDAFESSDASDFPFFFPPAPRFLSSSTYKNVSVCSQRYQEAGLRRLKASKRKLKRRKREIPFSEPQRAFRLSLYLRPSLFGLFYKAGSKCIIIEFVVLAIMFALYGLFTRVYHQLM